MAGSAWHDLDLVFTHAAGDGHRAGNLTRAWSRVLVAAGVGHVRWHDLRHAHATLLLQAASTRRSSSERLGHASVAITLDTYSHVLPGLQATAAAALDALLLHRIRAGSGGPVANGSKRPRTHPLRGPGGRFVLWKLVGGEGLEPPTPSV